MRQSQTVHSSSFDWPFRNNALPQGLSLDFLDLSTFPTSPPQNDPNSTSDFHSTADVHMGEHTPIDHLLRGNENWTGAELPDPSGPWHTSSRSGMIRPNLWSKNRSSGLIGQEADHTISEGSQTLPRSMLNLLSLKSILAIEDYGHVARVRPEQVEKMVSFMAMNQRERTQACPADCRGLLSNPDVINAFVQLYFEHFHWTFPLLHRPTFNVVEEPSLLLLATATIGSRFSKIPQAYTLARVLGDILRKTIDILVTLTYST